MSRLPVDGKLKEDLTALCKVGELLDPIQKFASFFILPISQVVQTAAQERKTAKRDGGGHAA